MKNPKTKHRTASFEKSEAKERIGLNQKGTLK